MAPVAQRKGASAVLRKGVWFTAGLAAFVVVCLIATYAGESVPAGQGHSLPLQVAPVRRSAMAVQEVAAAFKDADMSEQTTEAFSKQIQELHSVEARAVRILQDGALVERPCTAKGKSQIHRPRPTSKCYFPTPPIGPGPNCTVCVEGNVKYFNSEAEATQATISNKLGPSVCKSWKELFSAAFLSVDDEVTKFFGGALAADDNLRCAVSKAANDTGYQVTQGPYCVDLKLVNNPFTFYGDLVTNLANLTDSEILQKLDTIAESQGGACPVKSNSGVNIDSKYSFAEITEYCGNDTLPSNYTNLATGCDNTTSSH